ncbi:hypothetical protein PINS_up007710 [Pythium insidiosum]|nr:hypothetical protein PINS_up007710 [Pythium insidiosum]
MRAERHACRYHRNTALVEDVTGNLHEISEPKTEIEAVVEVSLIRSVCYIVGILLVLTDVPRTGLRTNIPAKYEVVAPAIAMYYGPYEYHIAHLTRLDNGINTSTYKVNGTCDDSKIDSLELWSYKFDSLSIPIRAMAAHLELRSFPRCLFYKTPYIYPGDAICEHPHAEQLD